MESSVTPIPNSLLTSQRFPQGLSGYRQMKCLKIVTPLATNTTQDFTWPIPISIMRFTIFGNGLATGDKITVKIAPDTVAAVSTENVAQGANSVFVSNHPPYQVGFKLSIFKNGNFDQVGEILAINRTTGEITFSNPTGTTYNAGSQVGATLVFADQMEIITDTALTGGGEAVNILPAGKPIRITFDSVALAVKTVRIYCEYIY